MMFELLMQIGYACGMINKIVNDEVNYVFGFYVLNFSLVMVDILLWLCNQKLDVMRAAGTLHDRAE